MKTGGSSYCSNKKKQKRNISCLLTKKERARVIWFECSGSRDKHSIYTHTHTHTNKHSDFSLVSDMNSVSGSDSLIHIHSLLYLGFNFLCFVYFVVIPFLFCVIVFSFFNLSMIYCVCAFLFFIIVIIIKIHCILGNFTFTFIY